MEEQAQAEGKVRRLVGLERRHCLGRKLLFFVECEVDSLAALLLEGGHDLPYRMVLLVVASLLPPRHEVGCAGAEWRQDQRRCEEGANEPLHGAHSARICLIRAMASSTACSGLTPSAATRWTALAQTNSPLTSWCRQLPEIAA